MSYADGIAALNLEMPDRVPRTKYSAETHWPLVSAVLGRELHSGMDPAVLYQASCDFRRAWSYDLIWSILFAGDVFGGKKTKMGHAEYASGGVDFDGDVASLFDDPEDALQFDPYEFYGTIDKAKTVAAFNQHYADLCRCNPECVNMTGIYVTCMSGLIEILGWETLLSAAGIDAKAFGAVTDRYAGWAAQYFAALAASDAPVVMVHDDIVWTSGAFLPPEWYRKYIFPNYRRLFAPLIEAGKKIIYTSDGDYTCFVDDIAACGVNAFVMEPMTDMGYIAEKYGKTHAFIGNADTRILLSGTKEDIYSEVKRCMDIGKRCPGFFMAVGNHIPANTPVDNALYYNEAYLALSKR